MQSVTGYAIAASGLIDMPTARVWREEAKDALYSAAELAEQYPTVLVYIARAAGSKISDGGAPVFKSVNGEFVVNNL